MINMLIMYRYLKRRENEEVIISNHLSGRTKKRFASNLPSEPCLPEGPRRESPSRGTSDIQIFDVRGA